MSDVKLFLITRITPHKTPLHRRYRAILGASALAPDMACVSGAHQRDRLVLHAQTRTIGDDPRTTAVGKDVVVDHPPNVVASNGPVVSTSTQIGRARCHGRVPDPDSGRCYLCSTPPARWIALRQDRLPLRWSPLQSCTTWLRQPSPWPARWSTWARGHARPRGVTGRRITLDRAGPGPPGTPAARRRPRGRRGHAHPPDLGGSTPGAAGPTDPGRRSAGPTTTELARNLLDGIVATDQRELSGIWSTASGGAQAGSGPSRPWRPLCGTLGLRSRARFVDRQPTPSTSLAPAHRQALVAPLVVGLIDDIRHATYARSARSITTPASTDRQPPVVLALDEVANHRPYPRSPVDDQRRRGRARDLTTLAVPPGPVPGPQPVAPTMPTGSRRCSGPRWCCPASAMSGR